MNRQQQIREIFSKPATASKIPVTFRNLLTKKQVLWIYAFVADNLKDRLPRKGETVVFPSPLEEGVSFLMRKTTEKAVYGGTLYEVLHYKSAVKPEGDDPKPAPYVGSLEEELDNEAFLDGGR